MGEKNSRYLKPTRVKTWKRSGESNRLLTIAVSHRVDSTEEGGGKSFHLRKSSHFLVSSNPYCTDESFSSIVGTEQLTGARILVSVTNRFLLSHLHTCPVPIPVTQKPRSLCELKINPTADVRFIVNILQAEKKK